MHRHELTEREWNRIAHLLPIKTPGSPGKPPELDNRIFMNAIYYIVKTGIPWRDLPERFGPWETVYARFSLWNRKGILQKVHDELAKDADHESNMADGSYVKVHRDASGGKRGAKIRRSVGHVAD
ncbi:MAG: IS5 family transposase [Myxococcales bacterium]|jgi:transposase|nr:IS5 family transposase [Myxococcales bacterium]